MSDSRLNVYRVEEKSTNVMEVRLTDKDAREMERWRFHMLTTGLDMVRRAFESPTEEAARK